MEQLTQQLIYGNYPGLSNHKDDESKANFLKEVIDEHLLKDVIAHERVRNTDKLIKLLQLISFNVGEEISYNELAEQLELTRNTVEKYLEVMAKAGIVHKVGGFGKKLKKEITKSSKWYFYDNGVRNALIANFNPEYLRNDMDQLFENYLISERAKKLNGAKNKYYFWRTYDQQEIDWVEEKSGKLFSYEFKWNEKKKSKVPVAWKDNYGEAKHKVISPSNYQSWLSSSKS